MTKVYHTIILLIIRYYHISFTAVLRKRLSTIQIPPGHLATPTPRGLTWTQARPPSPAQTQADNKNFTGTDVSVCPFATDTQIHFITNVRYTLSWISAAITLIIQNRKKGETYLKIHLSGLKWATEMSRRMRAVTQITCYNLKHNIYYVVMFGLLKVITACIMI